MYDWVTKKTNPLAGECLHNCSYCYVKGLKKRFPLLKAKYSGEPRLVESEFKKKFKEKDVIFVCTCNDLFADDVPYGLIKKIVDFYNKFESTIFYQTKNPENANIFQFSKNSILCTTIETNRHYNKIMDNSPKPITRTKYLGVINSLEYCKVAVTIEPILDFDFQEFISMIDFIRPVYVNIGADSGNNNLPEPPKEKILELISELEKFTKVKLKKNLNRLIN